MSDEQRALDERRTSGVHAPIRPTIWVIDDDPRIVRMLAWMLEDEGYRIGCFGDGASALEALEEERPELVLLDVAMPDLGGLDVCRQIKAGKRTRSIPIILVSALSSPSDEVAGLDAGADDYVVKPVTRSELLARVRAQLRIGRLLDEVIGAREEMARQHRRLRHLEQTRRDLTRMMIHDLKTPLTTIQLGLDLLANRQLQRTRESLERHLKPVAEAAAQLGNMIEQMLDVARLEDGAVRPNAIPLGLDRIVDALDRRFQLLAHQKGIVVELDLVTDAPPVRADASMLSRLLENLLANAVRYAPEGSAVRIATAVVDDMLQVSVADRGPGVPEELRERVFDRYWTGDPDRGHGLGLAYAKLAAEAHGGRIWVEPRDGGGSRFCFTLPLSNRPEPASN